MKLRHVAIISLLLAGCNPRVLVVPPGAPVQLAEDVKARVFIQMPNGQRIQSQERVRIPAGWWALPDDDLP